MTLITFVTRVHFADRVLEDALAEEMARLGMDRPIVLVDAEAGDEVDRLSDALPITATPVRLAVSVRSPADAALREATALFAEMECDGIVGCAARVRSTSRASSGEQGPRHRGSNWN